LRQRQQHGQNQFLPEDDPAPFDGVARVGYWPAHRILGLFKLARVVE